MSKVVHYEPAFFPLRFDPSGDSYFSRARDKQPLASFTGFCNHLLIRCLWAFASTAALSRPPAKSPCIMLKYVQYTQGKCTSPPIDYKKKTHSSCEIEYFFEAQNIDYHVCNSDNSKRNTSEYYVSKTVTRTVFASFDGNIV